MKDGLFKKEAKFMVGLYVLIPAIGIMAAIIIPYLSKTIGCDNRIVSVHTSPDGANKAVVFVRDCGATTDFNTQVSILPFRKELSNESGNAFIADSDHGKAATGQWGGPKIAVSWQGKDSIILRYANQSRVFKKEENIAGVHITYSEGITSANKEDAPGQKAAR
ncbi:hypothetical protein [Geomonas edaphica]|uniref:hypothetical protein n=1 Tax=Geomonas edaphica TaxID=2570226 RepID=UPI0010A833E5|nr:hypothetical protein [Geomonas edaphica]